MLVELTNLGCEDWLSEDLGRSKSRHMDKWIKYSELLGVLEFRAWGFGNSGIQGVGYAAANLEKESLVIWLVLSWTSAFGMLVHVPQEGASAFSSAKHLRFNALNLKP